MAEDWAPERFVSPGALFPEIPSYSSRSVSPLAGRQDGPSGAKCGTSGPAPRSGPRALRAGPGSPPPDPHHAAPGPTPPAACRAGTGRSRGDPAHWPCPPRGSGSRSHRGPARVGAGTGRSLRPASRAEPRVTATRSAGRPIRTGPRSHAAGRGTRWRWRGASSSCRWSR
jgi:hypothetical protein